VKSFSSEYKCKCHLYSASSQK